MPYLYTAVRETHDTGLPIVRALWLHYPDDRRAASRGDEYLWGRDILVAPVVEPGTAARRLYLPEGSWDDFWTEERVPGGPESARPRQVRFRRQSDGNRTRRHAGLVLGGTACKMTSAPPLFELRSPTETGIAFANTLREDDSVYNVLDFDYLSNGGGVAIADVNNDGLEDIYFAGNMVASRLYLNRGHFRFEDVTEAAGVGD